MKKIIALTTAFALASLAAFSGCQRQEEQRQPESAPTQTQQPSAPGTQ